MKYIFQILVIVVSPHAFAHGGDGGPLTNKSNAKVRHQARRAPHHPEEIIQAELDKHLSAKKIFADVIIIHCKLGEFTKCRGVEIGLYDLQGRLISKGYSGLSGVVGFEGLKAGEQFVAKIEGDKYRGEAHVIAGGSFRINAERQ